LVVAVLIAALLSEGAMRLAGFKPHVATVNPFFVPNSDSSWSIPDPELGWINKPGVSRSVEDGHAPMTFWDFGRRASRPDPAPLADRVPVMVIGGSNAQSYSVRDDDSFVSLLARRFDSLWFENFGNGGYSTVQAMLLAERAFDGFYTQPKPKLVILAFDDSHALRNVADQSWVFSITDSEGRYVAPPHFRLRSDTLVFHPFRTIAGWPLEKHSAAVTVLHNVWLQTVRYRSAAEALPVTRRVLSQLDAFARGAMFAVAVLEDRSRVFPRLFADQPFPVVDCSGPERDDPQTYLVGGNSHPNPRLHAYFAACIGAWLSESVIPKLTSATP
jgi:hypothetical protein